MSVQRLMEKAGGYRQGPALREGGFSLSEVLASITLICLFVAVGLQAMVSAIALETGTGKNQQADTWIQADLETVNLIASQLPVQMTLCQGQGGSYAQVLASQLGPTEFSQPFTVDGVTYTMTRQIGVSPDPNILVLQYQVQPKHGGTLLTQRRVEVMPNAVWQCP
jgi:hypothetical protein